MPPRALRVVLWSTVILFSVLVIVSVISRGVLLATAASENLSDVEKQVLEMMYGDSPRKLEALWRLRRCSSHRSSGTGISIFIAARAASSSSTPASRPWPPCFSE
ncbi:MAG: hypothetical protein ACXW19_06190 [Thermoanaerobaculia bacterium]